MEDVRARESTFPLDFNLSSSVAFATSLTPLSAFNLFAWGSLSSLPLVETASEVARLADGAGDAEAESDSRGRLARRF